jgi:retron-type reverse transcriptase
MSDHDRPFTRYSDPVDVLNPRWVSRHRGDRYDFMAKHRRQMKKVLKKGKAALDAIAPFLFSRVSDERALRVAWDHLQEHGGRAPGRNGLRFEDHDENAKWLVCRALRDVIRSGEYEPNEDRVVWVSKGPGRGERPICVQDIDDRVIQRAVVEIIQPLLDSRFDPHSMGYRPKKGRLDALALAERFLTHEKRVVWVTEDIRDAFSNVPISRLLQVIKKYLPADDLVKFIGTVLSNASTPGLRQGGCLSPLLLNIYLDHFLDRRWRKRRPRTPLIRVADDLLAICRTAKEAKKAHATLAALLRPAGMPLKIGFENAVRRLTEDEPAEWLGFRIVRGKKGLDYGITERAWERLAERLARANEAPDPVKQANAILRGWLGQMGPAYPHADKTVYARLRQVADAQGFTTRRSVIKGLWQRAFARWGKVRAKAKLAPATT